MRQISENAVKSSTFVKNKSNEYGNNVDRIN